MIGSFTSRCSQASKTKGAFALQPGILGVVVPRWQRTAGAAETLGTMNTWTVLLQDVMGVFDSSRMRRLTETKWDTKTKQETLFYSNKRTSFVITTLFHIKFTKVSLCTSIFLRGWTSEVCDSRRGQTLCSSYRRQTAEQLCATV